MRTLSVRQPWASLICSGVKDVENRTWAPPVSAIGGKLLIHASGKKVSGHEMRMLPFEWCSAIDNAVRYGWIPEFEDMPTGAIIGYVDLVGYSKDTKSLWDGGKELIKWIFENAYLFDVSIPAKGKLSVFDTPIDILSPAHKVIGVLPYRDGDVVVIPFSEKIADEALKEGMVMLDVTDDNLDILAEPKGDEYLLRPISMVKLVTPNGTVGFPVLRKDLFVDVYADTGGRLFILLFVGKSTENTWSRIIRSRLLRGRISFDFFNCCLWRYYSHFLEALPSPH